MRTLLLLLTLQAPALAQTALPPPTGPLPGTPAARSDLPMRPDYSGAGIGAAPIDSAGLARARSAQRMIGSSVYAANDQSLGEVEDILLLPGGGSAVAVISVGGFLGIGGRRVAVPFESLRRSAENGRLMLPGATRETLQGLPEFKPEGEAAR